MVLHQPKNHQPTQVVLVIVFEGLAVGGGVVVMVGLGLTSSLLVVVGSLQPNQPGVLQVVVVVDAEDVVVVIVVVIVVVRVLVPDEVVLSSRQPHHPGVLHVLVRVRELEVVLVLDVVVSEPLLSKYFQLKQSTHSVFAVQLGTLSYTSMTSLMTDNIP